MGAAGHNLAGGRERVCERGAGGAQIESPRPVRPDLVLQQAGGARKHHVGRHRANDDEPNIVGRQACPLNGFQCRLFGQI